MSWRDRVQDEHDTLIQQIEVQKDKITETQDLLAQLRADLAQMKADRDDQEALLATPPPTPVVV